MHNCIKFSDQVTITNVEEEDDDRLSSLPDELIHIILSSIGSLSLREVIRTCVLSSRWRFIWTSMPCLTFDKKIGEVALVALSSSKATTTLALTTLHLDCIALSDDHFTGLFSKCPNLKHLSFFSCQVSLILNGRNVMNICHPRLSTLTIDNSYVSVESLNVVAPQLKNLTIINMNWHYGMIGKQYLISAPGLTSLVIKSQLVLHVIPSQQGFPCLDKADLFCYNPSLAGDYDKLVPLLQHLHNVKFLTLNLEILELLSSSMEPVSHHHQPCPSANLNIVKFVDAGRSVYIEVPNVTEIKNNLQLSFPRAILTMISCEEISRMRDIISARKLISDILWLREWHGTDFMRHNQFQHKSYLREQVLTKLQLIEGLLTGLLAVSKSQSMQAIYFSVCQEAYVVKKNMLECTKIQYNNNNKTMQQQNRKLLRVQGRREYQYTMKTKVRVSYTHPKPKERRCSTS